VLLLLLLLLVAFLLPLLLLILKLLLVFVVLLLLVLGPLVLLGLLVRGRLKASSPRTFVVKPPTIRPSSPILLSQISLPLLLVDLVALRLRRQRHLIYLKRRAYTRGRILNNTSTKCTDFTIAGKNAGEDH
jgi:hypothetical protein